MKIEVKMHQEEIADLGEATEILYERYAATIFVYLLKHARSREDADDLHSGKMLFQHTNAQNGYMYHSDVNADIVYLLVARITSQQSTITNNTLYALQLSTGKVRWQYTANKIEEDSSGLSTDPVVAQ